MTRKSDTCHLKVSSFEKRSGFDITNAICELVLRLIERRVILENPNPSEIGREKQQEIEVSLNGKENDESELITFQELNRKVLDLNNIIPESKLENLIKYNKKNSSEEN